MDGSKGVILSETRQRKTNALWFYLYVGSQKKHQTHRNKDQRDHDQEEGGKGWVKMGRGI